MKRQVLKFDDIKGMLSEDEMMGIVGGCGQWFDGHVWHDGERYGSGGNPADYGSDMGGNPTSPDHILNGSGGGSGQGMTYGAFAAWAITQPEGTYINEGNGSFQYSPITNAQNQNGTGGTPIITVGTATPAGISQEVYFTNAGSYVPDYGGFLAAMSTAGTIGFSQNSDGQWLASAGFAITPPAGFEHASANGNVAVFINGNNVGGFSLTDARNGGSVIYQTGTVPLNGSFAMPTSFNGQGTVTLIIHTGAIENDGNYNYYTNSSQTVNLVLGQPQP